MRITKDDSSQVGEREVLYKKLCIILAIIIVGTLLFYNLKGNTKNIEPVFKESIEETDAELNSPILVHIKGEVLNPGVYEVRGDFRLKDAIDAAGGLTENANSDVLNLAMFITDGDEIIIPPLGSEASIINSSNINRDDGNKSSATSSLRININTASVEQLMQLPGIGQSLAEQIVQYRTYIKFKTISDLKNVPGIGNSKFDEIRNLIYVE